MGALQAIAIAMGTAWGSGVNLYATVLTLGLLGRYGAVQLPDEMAVLTHSGVLAVAGGLYGLEFLVDKVPGLDSLWDAIHSFIRIPAGAILAAQAIGDVNPAYEMMAYLAGGGIAATAFATKAGARAAINTSPEPLSNIAASVSEDVLTVGGVWASLFYPALIIIFVCLFLLFAVWFLPKIWRFFRGIYRGVWRRRTA